MTDNWESEEGYICQGAIIGFIELGAATVAGELAMYDTSVANKIVMKPTGNDAGDSVGVFLKGGVTGDKVPVCLYGVVKCVGHLTMDAGSAVLASATAGTTITYGNVIPATTVGTVNSDEILVRKFFNATGTAWTLGMALQTVAAAGDEILVLVGGAR